MFFNISFIFFPHWLYFKPHFVTWLFVSFYGEIKWASPLQVLKSTIHKLLKKSHCASFAANCKHSWVIIAELWVRVVLRAFGLHSSELYDYTTVCHCHLSFFLKCLRRLACNSNFAFPSKTCFDE